MKKLAAITLISLFCSCNPNNDDAPSGLRDAYVPVYTNASSITQIETLPPKPITSPGKIYAFGKYLFQNDLNTGVHIIDNSDRLNPRKIGFLKLPLSTEIAVKGNYLYANNFDDLVVFDISNPATPTLIKRVEDVFPAINQEYPSQSGVYFECADKSKGIVTAWELKKIETPKCRR